MVAFMMTTMANLDERGFVPVGVSFGKYVPMFQHGSSTH
jgi:hypothetical protein